MTEPSTLWLFILTTFVIAITPGPDQIYIANRASSQGKKAGLISALGVHTGIFFHILAAALGLATIIAASPLAFRLIQYAGASYLIYLGVRTLLAKPKLQAKPLSDKRSLRNIYAEGIIVNVLNPRAMLFFLAFLPQFVTQPNGAGLEIFLLGIVAIVISLPIDLGIGWLAGTLSDTFSAQRFLADYGKWLTGGIFLLLGATAYTGGMT